MAPGCKPGRREPYVGSNPTPCTISGSSSVGRASAFQAECREFESRLPLHNFYFQHVSPSSSGVERLLGKEEVTGSNPVLGSIGAFLVNYLFQTGEKIEDEQGKIRSQ